MRSTWHAGWCSHVPEQPGHAEPAYAAGMHQESAGGRRGGVISTSVKKKEKTEKAKKLYSQAFKKLEKAYKLDKKNPDVLNYMGFTSRKVGNFEKAEEFYLKGLNLKPDHNGINEYLGELYVQTNRIDKANERLEVLKNCNCNEYKELELIIKTRGSKVY